MTDGNALGVSDERRREIAAFNLETDEKICKPNDTKEIYSEGGDHFWSRKLRKIHSPAHRLPAEYFSWNHIQTILTGSRPESW